MRVEIQRGSTRISVEGSLDEIREILTTYWEGDSDESSADEKEPKKPVIRKAKIKSRKPTSGQSEENKDVESNSIDINAFVNGLKDRGDYDLIEAQILNGKNRWRKIRLVYGVADMDMTTGDVHRILEALDVKMSLGGVSTVVNKNMRHLFTSETRKRGATPKYRLTGNAKTEYRKDIDTLKGGTV